jgi:2-(1,2-epoxy-1,2-dihydrophenyl)acetyl-CoA isomerase
MNESPPGAMQGTLHSVLADGVLTLTLNRPHKLNAIDNDMARALLAALHAAGADAAVRVVRLRGNGRAFCAGRDVGAAPTEDDLVLVQGVARAIVTLPQPVLVAVHGWVVGAGFEWMMDADIAIAAESARFKLPEASIGVFVTGGLVAALPAAAGLARAKALMLLGETFTAAQAREWGLVWAVVADAELDAASARLAAQLAALAPDLVRRYKQVLNRIGLAAFEAAIGAENDAQRALQRGPPGG